jgi:hypothetical protein
MTDFFDELFSLKPEEAPMRDTSALFNSLMLSSISQFTDEADGWRCIAHHRDVREICLR